VSYTLPPSPSATAIHSVQTLRVRLTSEQVWREAGLPLNVGGSARRRQAEERWRPWQERFLALRADGLSIRSARAVVQGQAAAEGERLSDTQIKHWLRDS
jgi:hypothetical protein